MKKTVFGALIAVGVIATIAATCDTATSTTAVASGVLVESCVLDRVATQPVDYAVLTFASWDAARPGSPTWCAPGPTVIVPADGVYVISLQSAWQLGNVSGHRYVHVERDPAAGGNHEVLIGFSRAATEEGASLSSAWTGALSAGDQIRVALYQDSGSNLTWGGYNRSPGNPITSSLNAELGMTRVG